MCACVKMCVYIIIFNSHERIGVLRLQREYLYSSKSAVNIHHHYQTIPQHHQGIWEERSRHLAPELRREIQKSGHLKLKDSL